MSVHKWIHACVYTCVCMCRWLCVGLQCLQCVSNGDAAVLRRAIDMLSHSRMHANTCMPMAWCETAVSPVRQQWARPSTCVFKHQNMCCTLRKNDRRFDILVVAGGTRGRLNDNIVAAGDDRNVGLTIFSCMCCGHSIHGIQMDI